MSRILYRSERGRDIVNHSHSGGSVWSCPRKYKLKKISGWQQKEDGPALAFGIALEKALQYYHVHGREKGSGVDEFKILWLKYKDDPEIKYTEKSGDWEDHYRMGAEMLRLYEYILPTLPIDNEQFQVKEVVDLFPHNEEYNGIGYDARADIICEVDNNHPALPPLDGGPTRRLIVDIKTSSNPYHSDPRLSALDEQLIDYSWVFDIPTVSFLVFVKNPSGIVSSDWVTVLSGDKAGKQYIAYDINEERVLVLPKSLYDELQDRKKGIKGKGSKGRLEELSAEYFYKGLRFKPEDLTKQKIQFLPAIIDEQTRADAQMVARQEAMAIADAYAADFWPKMPGVRFPHNQCLNCEMLGICAGIPELVEERLVKISNEF